MPFPCAAVVPLLLVPVTPAAAADPTAAAGAGAWESYAPLYAEPLSPAHLATLAQEVAEEDGLYQWTGSLAASALYATGNNSDRSVSVDFAAEYRRKPDRTTLKALWYYKDEEDAVTDERFLTDRKFNAQAQYDRFLSKRLYVYGRLSYDSDFDQALESRYQVGAGAGYQWVEREDLKLGTEGGLSWISEDYVGEPENDYLAARLAYKFFWQIAAAWTFAQDTEYLKSLEEGSDWSLKVDSRLRVALTASFFAQLQHIFEFDNTPAPGNVEDDHRVILSIGWSF